LNLYVSDFIFKILVKLDKNLINNYPLYEGCPLYTSLFSFKFIREFQWIFATKWLNMNNPRCNRWNRG